MLDFADAFGARLGASETADAPGLLTNCQNESASERSNLRQSRHATSFTGLVESSQRFGIHQRVACERICLDAMPRKGAAKPLPRECSAEASISGYTPGAMPCWTTAISYHAVDLRFSRMMRGCLKAIRSSARAGPSGVRRPCSQFRKV